MSNQKIFLVLSDSATGQTLEREVLRPANFEVALMEDFKTLELLFEGGPPDLVLMGDQLPEGNGLELGKKLFERYPQLPVVLLSKEYSDQRAIEALRLGFVDCLPLSSEPNELLKSAEGALSQSRRMKEWAYLETERNTRPLQQRIKGLEALQRVGRKVTAELDLDSVLTAVVDAAVDLTGAEEGSLLLLDEETGELAIRASRNFKDEFVRTFRLPTQDSLAGQVLRTGKPVMIHSTTPRKIKTAYLVYSLIYVPLIVQDRVIGVVEVDNRQGGKEFSEDHLALVSALADYAAIAIENARLYSNTKIERNQLETILTKVDEGVIVVDPYGRILLVNRAARAAFHLNGQKLAGKRVQEVILHPGLLEILTEENRTKPAQVEIQLDDGRTLNTQLTPIPEVGLAATMQDITYLKELDRIKSDFVNTVSHDLRSPLTAILGYVELIDRVGTVNEQQKEFIHRVEVSVTNITALIDDLLDLGRIEAGFDARKEVVPFEPIVQYTVESLKSRAEEKSQEITLDLPESSHQLLGNPVRLRQMVNNLVGNAIKYTQVGGKIMVQVQTEQDQLILQVSDNGPGIPPADQAYIFDKFYRASNIDVETPGTGLGLAIVKSIIENHQGRIWVDSKANQGTTFTIVLPIVYQEL
jgi:two-component system NtrC family sensor kinase